MHAAHLTTQYYTQPRPPINQAENLLFLLADELFSLRPMRNRSTTTSEYML